MSFISYYVQKGFKIDYLINLTANEKDFMFASMLVSIEDEGKKWENLSGLFSL